LPKYLFNTLLKHSFENLILLFCILINTISFAQTTIRTVTADGMPLQMANIVLKTLKNQPSVANGSYHFDGVPMGNYEITAPIPFSQTQRITITDTTEIILDFNVRDDNTLDEIVITGTLKPVSRMESPVPVEVYKPVFFQKNPTANIFEALQNVNGVRPQLNCNVCNTGDIHINGLEGPYTLVLIDGMPIVSGLSTVYGLSNPLLERIEIVKGPLPLYGSEAVGGLINIITKTKMRPFFLLMPLPPAGVK
jgi:outer membrane receptor for ferrienterochelin and colicins